MFRVGFRSALGLVVAIGCSGVGWEEYTAPRAHRVLVSEAYNCRCAPGSLGLQSKDTRDETSTYDTRADRVYSTTRSHN